MSPQGKSTLIAELNKRGHQTLMCGDGGNDVGALKQSDVGLALLSGYGNVNTSDVADPTKALDVHFDEATNWLVVPNIAQDGGVANRFKPRVDGAFHVYDWAFFFGNVRQNIRDRLAAHKTKYG